ncbi:MAG: hypothetical protein H6733_03435 [Alphaproteobacteria bacterium]|nr:hypothetical protein [Alphaproteobacteria bacterium]
MLALLWSSLALATPFPPRMALETQTLVPGELASFYVTGAPPGLPVTLLRSLGGPGAGPCRPAQGVCLDVLPALQVVGTRTADVWGRVTFQATVPSLPPDDAWWQAVALGPGVGFVSEVVYLPVATPCVDDAAEDDDTSSTATLATGTFHRVSCPGDSDVWRIPVAAGSYLRADLSSDAEADGAVRVDVMLSLSVREAASTLYDGVGTAAVANTTTFGQTATVTVTAAADEHAAGIPYTLTLASAPRPTCGGYAQEPDDTVSEATLMTDGASVQGHACRFDPDYLAFDAQAGDAIQVDVDYDRSRDDCLLLTLYDPSGAVIDEGDYSCHSRVARVAPVTGRYTARLTFEEDDALGGGVPYTATVLAAPRVPCPIDAFEPNDTGPTAAPLAPGTYTGLGGCNADGIDWYAVDLLPWQQIEVEIPYASVDEGDGSIGLLLVDGPVPNADIYDHTLFDEQYNNGSRRRIHTSPTGGTVYVVVPSTSDTGVWQKSYRTVGGTTYDLVVQVR